MHIFHGNFVDRFFIVSTARFLGKKAPGSGMHTSTCRWQQPNVHGIVHNRKPVTAVASTGPRNGEPGDMLLGAMASATGWMLLERFGISDFDIHGNFGCSIIFVIRNIINLSKNIQTKNPWISLNLRPVMLKGLVHKSSEAFEGGVGTGEALRPAESPRIKCRCWHQLMWKPLSFRLRCCCWN